MNLTEFFSLVLVFLHCNVRTGCVVIKLDRFGVQCYDFDPNCKKSAGSMYNVSGSIGLAVREEMPNALKYEGLCPPTEGCLTYGGSGSWAAFHFKSPTGCRENVVDYYSGCYQSGERTYRFYEYIGLYYAIRLCKFRVRGCVTKDDMHHSICGRPSNEISASDIQTDKRYGYDTSEDEPYRLYEIRCKNRDKRYRAAKNGKEETRRHSDDFLMIFGVVLAINMIVFC